MRIVLWILQAALALLYLSGGAYKLLNFDEIANQMAPLSRGGSAALGVFEIVGAVLLIVPAAVKRMEFVTPLAAALLSLETLALAGLYAQHSIEITATNPMVWAAAMGLLAVFVTGGRYALGRRAATSPLP